ncbi:MAG: OmpW/AlkL family protein [Beijerinckiaceae bacterium]
MTFSLRIAAAAALGFLALPAVAADLPQRAPAPAPVMTYEPFDPWMIRLRVIGVLPDGDSKVSVGGAPYVNGLKISNAVVPELDITYFFTKNIAVEAICCLAPHSIKGSKALAGVGEIGDTLLFPPTVMLQYHFTNFGAFKPYVGVGVNWTHYFNNDAKGLFNSLKIDDSFGVAAQIGFDYMINRNWGINFDVKRILMRPDATVRLGAVPITAKVHIDPWIVGAGIVYRFGGGSAGPVVARY